MPLDKTSALLIIFKKDFGIQKKDTTFAIPNGK